MFVFLDKIIYKVSQQKPEQKNVKKKLKLMGMDSISKFRLTYYTCVENVFNLL